MSTERLTAADVLAEGGEWLGAARRWLQWNRCGHGNGERVTWGSDEAISPPICAREVEEIAAAAVAADRSARSSPGSGDEGREAVHAIRDVWLSARTTDETPPGCYLVDSEPMLRAHEVMRRALSSPGSSPRATSPSDVPTLIRAIRDACERNGWAAPDEESMTAMWSAALSAAPVSVPAPGDGALRTIAQKVLDEVDDLAAESNGVAGLHLNGEVADWEWVYGEWLESLAALRRALDASPGAPGTNSSKEG